VKPKKQPNTKDMRLKLRMNQTDYWRGVGVTQSCGSRYESGRRIPQPICTLIDLRFGASPLKALAELRGTTVKALIEGGK
jgi:hypothetical protein